MQQGNYGENYQSHLIEQYKLFVEMADRISARRGQTNSFYISLLSALLALLSLVIDKDLFSGPASVLLFFTALIGLALCLTWYVNIQSYRQLNGLKFQVIHEIEALLPFPCYKREWDLLKEQRGKQKKQYIQLTTVEKYVPLIFTVPYIGLLLYTLLVFIGVIGLPASTP
ncbi:RipA family octameric membrane protein [Leptothoe spongobia]|uniref:Uncharacterized protein n=1 Tax=Leptothoe spongobia TAU-MAC 1115 TaxID=1967444 RepID=A0A947GKU6_9CYAN|nr:hypothetical protein [Leptothoe spongobia]MBT9317829.1 hypothetical protein [Leptothoe spongobia TAU-MAC 1115]